MVDISLHGLVAHFLSNSSIFLFFGGYFYLTANGGHMHAWVQVLFCKDGSSAPTLGPR